MRFCRKRVAQDAQIGALGHGIAIGEIAKCDRHGIGRDVGHVFGHQHGITHQTRRFARRQTIGPQETTIRILQLAHCASGFGIHHECRIGAVLRTQRIHQINDRIGTVEIAIGTGGHITQIAPGPAVIVHRRMRQEPLGLVDAIARHECTGFGTGEFRGNTTRQPGFDIKRAVVQQALRCFGQGRQFVQGDGNTVNRRGAGFHGRCRFGRPAMANIGVINQHVIGCALDIHHIGNRTDRTGGRQNRTDRIRRFRINQIAAIAIHSGGQGFAIQLQTTQAVVITGTDIGVERLLMGHFGLG